MADGELHMAAGYAGPRTRRPLSPSKSMKHPVNQAHHVSADLGGRMADKVAAAVGSWYFLGVQTLIITVWIALNVIGLFALHWDPYPFILLNLLFSTQAAYAAPILQLSGNRQAQKDRLTLEHAAAEGDKADEQNQRILAEILKNTELTLKLHEHFGVPADGKS